MNVNVSLIPEGNLAPTEIVPWKPVASILFLNLPLDSNASHTDRKSSVTANVGLFVLIDINVVLPLLGKFPGRLQVSISPFIFHRPLTPTNYWDEMFCQNLPSREKLLIRALMLRVALCENHASLYFFRDSYVSKIKTPCNFARVLIFKKLQLFN